MTHGRAIDAMLCVMTHHTPTPSMQGRTAGAYLRALIAARGEFDAAHAMLMAGPDDRDHVSAARACLAKAAQGAMTDEDLAAATRPVGIDLGALERGGPSVYAALKRLGARQLPFRTKVVEQLAGATATFVPAGAAIPVQVLALNGAEALLPHKIATIHAQTDELARAAPALAEATLAADAVSAISAGTDLVLCDPLLAPTDDTPGGLCFDAPAVSCTGSSVAAIDADLAALLQLVTQAGYLGTMWTMPARTLAYLQTLRSGDALAFPSLQAAAPILHGRPVVASAALPLAGSPGAASIQLVDVGGVRYADDGAVALDVSKRAALQLDSAPTQDAMTPTGSSTVSMWQTSSTAIRAVAFRTWRLANRRAAAVLTGVPY